MIRHARERPVFGWGGYRRSWPVDSFTGEYQIRGLDGLWTIIIGQNGLYGVGLLFASLLTPVTAVLFRKQSRNWGSSDYAAYEVLSISLLIFTCDCLLNGMFNPLFLLIAGAITTRPISTAAATITTPTTLLQPACVPRTLRRINGTAAARIPSPLEH
jgi:hypothetical protein